MGAEVVGLSPRFWIKAPQLLAGGGVEGGDDAQGRAGVEDAVDDKRRGAVEHRVEANVVAFEDLRTGRAPAPGQDQL